MNLSTVDRIPPTARKVTPLPVGHLVANPFQPRLVIDDRELAPLVESIRRYGFMGHIEVRHDPADHGRPLQIVFGHRRVEAAKRAGLATVPAVIIERSDDQMRRITFVENAARKGLSYWEEAVFLGTMKRDLGLSVRQIAEAVCVSRSYIQERLDLLKIPDGPLKEAAERDEIGFSTVWLLTQMPPDERDVLLAQVKAGELNVSGLRTLRQAHARRREELERAAEDDAESSVPLPATVPPVQMRWVEPPNPFIKTRDVPSAPVSHPVDVPSRSSSMAGGVPARPPAWNGDRSNSNHLGESNASSAYRREAVPGGTTVATPPTAFVEDVPDQSVALPRVVHDRTLIPRTTGHDYAVEAIRQLEANAYHLRIKMAKADFATLTTEEETQLERAKAEFRELLDTLP